MTKFLLSLAAWVLGSSFALAQEACPIPTATPEHKIVTADEGTWDAAIKSYPNGPDSAPMVTKGTEVNTVVSGGLWLSSTFKADFGGMAYEGRGQFGYDPARKKYVGTWIDSMNPTISLLEGSYDARTKTLTYKGDGVCPKDGSKMTQRMVTTAKADGTREFAFYVSGVQTGGKEVKAMEITYTKRK